MGEIYIIYPLEEISDSKKSRLILKLHTLQFEIRKIG